VQLKEKTMKKLSEPTLKVLEAASVDVEAWIEDVGEDWINARKRNSAYQSKKP
jgi:predicted phage gp36 major capsid-like protein